MDGETEVLTIGGMYFRRTRSEGGDVLAQLDNPTTAEIESAKPVLVHAPPSVADSTDNGTTASISAFADDAGTDAAVPASSAKAEILADLPSNLEPTSSDNKVQSNLHNDISSIHESSSNRRTSVLVTGVAGQIGSELLVALAKTHDDAIIVGTYNRTKPPGWVQSQNNIAALEPLDICDRSAWQTIITKYNVTIVYHLAAMLSAAGEHAPQRCITTNLDSVRHILDLATAASPPLQVFCASSIAVFGPSTPRLLAPQQVYHDPTTIYGVTKRCSEMMCAYFSSASSASSESLRCDVRSLRYPGVLTARTTPSGGTSDYALEMIHHACQHHWKEWRRRSRSSIAAERDDYGGSAARAPATAPAAAVDVDEHVDGDVDVKHMTYSCYLRRSTSLPWMHMDDAVEATMALMKCDRQRISVFDAYNIQACVFSPFELYVVLKSNHFPSFQCTFPDDDDDDDDDDGNVDPRQRIADSVPMAMDDTQLRDDLQWKPKYTFETMVNRLVEDIIIQYEENATVGVVVEDDNDNGSKDNNSDTDQLESVDDVKDVEHSLDVQEEAKAVQAEKGGKDGKNGKGGDAARDSESGSGAQEQQQKQKRKRNRKNKKK